MQGLGLAHLRALLGVTLRDPAAGAARILDLGLPRDVLWLALLLVTVLSVVLASLVQGPVMVLPLGETVLYATPFSYAVILGSSLIIMVFAIHWTGAALGGQGEFPGALAIVVWTEVLGIMVRLAQTVALLFGQSLAGIVGLLGLGFLAWAFLNFVNELHEFDSLGRSFLTVLLALLGIGVGLGLILSIIGVGTAAAGGI